MILLMRYAEDIIAAEIFMKSLRGALIDSHIETAIPEDWYKIGQVGLYASDRHP